MSDDLWVTPLNLWLATRFSTESFIEVLDTACSKIKFEVCCVVLNYSTRFLNCSTVDVDLLALDIALRVKKQELRKRKKILPFDNRYRDYHGIAENRV